MPSFLSPINLNKNELQNAVVQNLASAPASPIKGQLYYDTPSNTLYWWNNTAWIPAQSGAPSYGVVGASAVGDAIAGGVSSSVARADHVHGREAFGNITAQTTYGLTSSNGAAVTLPRSDHTHGTPAVPTAAAVGAVGNAGAVPSISAGVTGSRPAAGNVGVLYLDITTFLLYRDNGTTWDQIDGFGLPAASAVGAAQAAGTATTFARSDHVHAREAFAIVGASAVGDVAGAGTALTVAHSDHVHAREAFGNVTSQLAFAAAAGNGVAVTLPRSDHVHGTPTHDSAAHSAIPLSALAQPTAPVNMGGQRITNGADPTSATDFSTKQYVDNARAGLSIKDPVRAASTANVTVASALITGLVMDGVTLAAGDRVLLKNQTAPAENGLWTVVASGAATRTTDADGSGEIVDGTAVWIQTGTVNGDQRWVASSVSATPWVPGTSSSTWTMDFAATSVTAGAGLTGAGQVLAVGAGAGIVVAADSVTVDRATNGSIVPFKYSAAIGDGASTSIVVTHGLNTQDVHVALYASGTPFAEVQADIAHTTVNTITLTFAVAPASNAYRVVVIG